MGVTAVIAGLACVFLAVRLQERLMTRDRHIRRGLLPVPRFGREFARGYINGLAIYLFGSLGLVLIAGGVFQIASA